MNNHPADHTPHPSPLREDADARLPAAAFLRYESRADGWSAGRQAAFLAHLADHGIVEDAARCVGKHVSGGYALRREARGYAFNLGWEAALIIARRIVADNLMAAAIKGEQSRWVREDGVTTYIRQNTKLSMTLLDRINPATSLPEVMAVATRFDCFLQMIDDGLGGQELWDYFFDEALPHSEVAARARVRAALLLCDESAGFDDDDADTDETDRAGPIEYKSMDGPPTPAPNQIFTARALLCGMLGQKQFGKLGNRSTGRLATEIDAGLVLPERSARCRVENVSRNGCRLSLDVPPRLGATVLVRVERIETLGTVAWVRGVRCGVTFERPIDIAALERLRWIVEHATAHEQNSLSTATAVWR